MALAEFLRKTKETSRKLSTVEESKQIFHFVLGNESCDLDSAVCSVLLSLLLHSQGEVAIPLLNIPSADFALRTEVTYLFQQNGISADLLTFRDDLDLSALRAAGRLRLTLVDHHALPARDRQLAPSVVAVLDHRPLDQDAVAALPEGCATDVRPVGSCASLVAERILKEAPELLDRQVADLIRGTVLLDTACFSPQADRTTPLDLAVAEACEDKWSIEESRSATFDRIISARKDVSSLTSFQILHKDMKVVRGLPLPGMPLLVRDFAGRADAASALAEFCAKHSSEAAVVLGMSFAGEPPGTLRRDLAVYSRGAEQPAKQLAETLQGEEWLQLTPRPCQVPGMALFDQGNTKASRKQILPVVQRALGTDKGYLPLSVALGAGSGGE